MRMLVLIPALAAAALLVTPATVQAGGNPPGKEANQQFASKVKELQQERIATLKSLADLNTRLFQSGQVSLEDALEARVLVVEAELEAAETQADRITLYQGLVDVLKQYEETANQRVKVGRATETAVLKVKAKRLQAEIHLEQAKAKQPDLVQPKIGVTSPQAKDIDITQRYAGQIHSRRHINIRSLESGYLAEVLVKEGQAVKKGDVLFKILPILYEAKLDAALAEVKVAQLELKNAEKLFQSKVVSQVEVALSQAKLTQAQAKAKLAEAELNFTEIKAPFDGIVGRFPEQQGSLAEEGDTLTTLSDNSTMWVYFNVPQARYLEFMVDPEQPQEMEIDLELAHGKKFAYPGRFGAIEAQFNNETGNIPFRADFPNPDRLLRHGMTGNVLIHRPLHNATVIPQRATFEVLDKRYVYVVDKNDVAHRREVVIQHELPDVFVIGKGVGVDDRIVFEGIRQVRDGEKVEYEFLSPDRVFRLLDGETGAGEVE